MPLTYWTKPARAVFVIGLKGDNAANTDGVGMLSTLSIKLMLSSIIRTAT